MLVFEHQSLLQLHVGDIHNSRPHVFLDTKRLKSHNPYTAEQMSDLGTYSVSKSMKSVT